MYPPLHLLSFLLHTLHCFCETLCQFFLPQHPMKTHNCLKNTTPSRFHYFHIPTHFNPSNRQAVRSSCHLMYSQADWKAGLSVKLVLRQWLHNWYSCREQGKRSKNHPVMETGQENLSSLTCTFRPRGASGRGRSRHWRTFRNGFRLDRYSLISWTRSLSTR